TRRSEEALVRADGTGHSRTPRFQTRIRCHVGGRPSPTRTVMTSRPPAFARLLLHCCIHPVDRDEVMGDLAELYAYQREDYGRFRADVWYVGQVLRSCPFFLFN